MSAMDSWLKRCLTCKHAMLGKTLQDTECKVQSCNYTPMSESLSAEESIPQDTYICRKCHNKFSKSQMYSESFWVFEAYNYCRSCMEDYKASYYEVKSFRDSFSKI